MTFSLIFVLILLLLTLIVTLAYFKHKKDTEEKLSSYRDEIQKGLETQDNLVTDYKNKLESVKNSKISAINIKEINNFSTKLNLLDSRMKFLEEEVRKSNKILSGQLGILEEILLKNFDISKEELDSIKTEMKKEKEEIAKTSKEFDEFDALRSKKESEVASEEDVKIAEKNVDEAGGVEELDTVYEKKGSEEVMNDFLEDGGEQVNEELESGNTDGGLLEDKEEEIENKGGIMSEEGATQDLTKQAKEEEEVTEETKFGGEEPSDEYKTEKEKEKEDKKRKNELEEIESLEDNVDIPAETISDEVEKLEEEKLYEGDNIIDNKDIEADIEHIEVQDDAENQSKEESEKVSEDTTDREENEEIEENKENKENEKELEEEVETKKDDSDESAKTDYDEEINNLDLEGMDAFDYEDELEEKDENEKEEEKQTEELIEDEEEDQESDSTGGSDSTTNMANEDDEIAKALRELQAMNKRGGLSEKRNLVSSKQDGDNISIKNPNDFINDSEKALFGDNGIAKTKKEEVELENARDNDKYVNLTEDKKEEVKEAEESIQDIEKKVSEDETVTSEVEPIIKEDIVDEDTSMNEEEKSHDSSNIKASVERLKSKLNLPTADDEE